MRKISTRIAAFAALGVLIIGGATATAASHWLITSTHQIKPSVLKQLKGKAGPAGPAGVAGLPGAAGAAGPSGLSGRVIVTQTVSIPPTDFQVANPQPMTVTATCPAGKSLLGANYSIGGNPFNGGVYQQGGIVPTDTSASAPFWNYGGQAGDATVYAICATVS